MRVLNKLNKSRGRHLPVMVHLHGWAVGVTCVAIKNGAHVLNEPSGDWLVASCRGIDFGSQGGLVGLAKLMKALACQFGSDVRRLSFKCLLFQNCFGQHGVVGPTSFARRPALFHCPFILVHIEFYGRRL